jgi:hypothetical protein
MASELREVLDDLDDAVNARENTCHPMSAGYERNSAWDQYRAARKAIEELPLLTPAAKAVLDRACKLQDMADATGVDMEDDLFAASWGSFSRAVLAYQETRGSDAN